MERSHCKTAVRRFAKITRMGHEQIRYLLFPDCAEAGRPPSANSCLSVFVRDIEQNLVLAAFLVVDDFLQG